MTPRLSPERTFALLNQLRVIGSPISMTDVADALMDNADLTARLAEKDAEAESNRLDADRLLSEFSKAQRQIGAMQDQIAALTAASLAPGTRADGLRQAAEIVERAEKTLHDHWAISSDGSHSHIEFGGAHRAVRSVAATIRAELAQEAGA